MEEKESELTCAAVIEVGRYQKETFDKWDRWVIANSKYTPQPADIASAAAGGWIDGYLFAKGEAHFLEPKSAKEPTPADAKPEIKKGSWVVCQNETYQVVDVDYNIQDVVLKFHTRSGSYLNMTYKIENVRPWKPADIKKGDYLTYDLGDDEKIIFITPYNGELNISCCGYNTRKGYFWDKDQCWLGGCDDNIHPAIYEEMKLLDTKIAEHGLCWNYKKLKLEKKGMPDIAGAFPYIDYKRLQQTIEDFGKRLDRIEEKMKGLDKEIL